MGESDLVMSVHLSWDPDGTSSVSKISNFQCFSVDLPENMG